MKWDDVAAAVDALFGLGPDLREAVARGDLYSVMRISRLLRESAEVIERNAVLGLLEPRPRGIRIPAGNGYVFVLEMPPTEPEKS